MKKVIISQRAYRSMLAEVYERIETETGGIFLGHRDGDTWYVLESVEPGMKSIFTPTYFEYDDEYVTYRANKLQRLYKSSIDLLGLWHRHPGLMKTFSSTDDVTNKTYSDLLGGAISGLVTLGNGFEITMYYVPSNVRYEKIECIVDESLIPAEYLKYYDTAYYKRLINGIAEKEYGSFEMISEQTSVELRQSDIPKKKKFFPVISNILSDFFNGSDREELSNTSKHMSDNDITIIFDAIEQEIVYLQNLEAIGNVTSTIQSTKDSDDREELVLIIHDLRSDAKYRWELRFFITNNSIMVKNAHGKIMPYEGNLIQRLFGGNND